MIDVLLHTKMSPPGGLENPGPNTLGLPAVDDEKLKKKKIISYLNLNKFYLCANDSFDASFLNIFCILGSFEFSSASSAISPQT